MSEDAMKQRNFFCPDELWEDADKAARLASLREGENVSRSHLLRRGLRNEVERIMSEEEQ